ncbi:PAS domain S-box protein [Massilia niastensis]|uniref:PAS domain S-box protein n=1 Tax=Massilia niastensis TaxID=544911 RepID=UPI0003604039|nr:PAS domain S-box protein [Massilia niastensis]
MADPRTTFASAGIDDVLITDQLAVRPARTPDYRAESEAMAALARALAVNPRGVMDRLVELVLPLCRADSAGISLFEPGGEHGLFRWHAIAGAFAHHLGGTMPGEASPCSTVLLRNEVLLFSEPERHFPALRGLSPHTHEALLVPWVVDGVPVGTVWALAHGLERRFDAEDARLLRSLADFAAASHRTVMAFEAAETARRHVELEVAQRTRELAGANEQLRRMVETRARSEAALRESNSFLRSAMSIETVGVLFFDLDGNVVDCNAAFERMCGYCLAELRALPHWEQLTAPGFHEVTGRAAGELADSGKTRPYMKEFVCKDGSTRWALCAPSRLSGSGEASRCIEFILDISEYKRQEEALREREERFRILIEGVAQAQWETNPGGLVVADSPSWRAFTGQSVDEWMGYGWVNAIHPDDREAALQQWTEAVAARRVLNTEFRLRRPNGSWCWTNARAAPQVGPDGRIQRWIGLNIDIDERRRTQEELRESEMRFRTLADAAPALIYEFDADSGMVYANRKCQEVFGRTGEPIARSVWRERLHPDDAPGYLEIVDLAIEGHTTFQARVRVQDAHGRWRWFESHGAPRFHASGVYRSHVGISLDITDAVRIEEELKDADRRKDEFLATLAHELRNPLAPISNAVHLLRRPDGRRAADRLVEMVGRQVRQIVRLVDDLLEVSRITRGKLVLSMETVALADIVATAVETSTPVIEQGQHRLEVTLPDPPVMLEADRVRLTQVLSNLLNNAAKYTDRGGCIRLSAWREGDEVALSVRDNGIGIPAESLPHVFEMFAQVHRDSWRGQGGLGIGLTMVRSLAEMHGGRVEARSAGVQQGSEFIVHLPLSGAGEGDGQAQGTGARSDAPLRGQRILVVDDNRDAADSLAMLLHGDGAEVRAVYGGEAALAAVAEFHPSTVLLDLGMPGMDGFETARRLRALEGGRALGLVALTGWGQEADRRRTQEAGFDRHLTKPVDIRALEAYLLQARPAPGPGA